MSMIDDPARGTAPLSGTTEFDRAGLMGRFTLCEILVAFGAALAFAGILLQIYFIAKLQGLVAEYGWGKVPRDLVFDGAAIDQATWILSLLGYLVVIAAFFTGMGRARRIAAEVLAARFEYGFGWTVGSIFIPIVCLFRPWTGLAEIRAKLTPDGDSSNGATWAVGVAFFLGGGVNFVLAMALKAQTAPDVSNFTNWSQDMIAIFVGIIVARSVTYGALFLYLVTLHRPLRRLATRPTQILALFD